MRRIAASLALVAASAAAAAQLAWQPLPGAAATPVLPSALPAATALPTSISYALDDWRRLRLGNYGFASYARFLIANPGWPGESSMRRAAERAMLPGEDPATVIAFFAKQPPRSATGHARLAEAHAAFGRLGEAQAAARSAWTASGLGATDELMIVTRFGQGLTTADHEQRIDRLLFDRDTANAERTLASAGPLRRAAFAARIAMQNRAINADAIYAAVAGQVTSDAGLMADRARYLRATGRGEWARQLLARQHRFIHRPADPERWYELMLLVAREAAEAYQWQTAYDIARQVDDAFPAGTDISDQAMPIRDHYTSLTWLAGTTALHRLRRPLDAVRLFELYSGGGRSLQVATKGLYWAGRAATAAGLAEQGIGYFNRAAAYPDQFYGQLALERLGRPVPSPGGLPTLLVTPEQRLAFDRRRLVQAVTLLGRQGRPDEQALFIRALAEGLTSDSERVLASELASRIGRQDLAVWTARAARNAGSPFYYRTGYPLLATANSGRLWSVVHGITRQESSFDRRAVSGAGARGMMQLMLGTAREQAGKMGVGYDYARLTSDPAYNVMLGSAYFQRLLGRWGGSYPLAVASYNAGAGNVARWIARNGDPRTGQVDIIHWIEAIPFTETRGYVQRVLENTVVYDRLNPAMPLAMGGPRHLSAYLGKSRPG